MIFDKIIYINLDRRLDRNLNVIEQLKKVGLNEMAERFSAIDGKKLDLNNMDTNIITQEGIEYAKKSDIIYTHLTLGAIGCAMSHKAIYQKILDENINSCLILEDDITLDDRFIEQIKILENELKVNDYDLFFLGYHPGSTYDDNQKFKTVYGLFGYIVTKSGAKKLLDLFPITYQIDTEISRNTNKINIFGVDVLNKIILSDQSQYSYKFGTDIQVKNDNIKVNKKSNNSGYVYGYVFVYVWLALFIILSLII